MELDDDAKAVANLDSDGHWYLDFKNVETIEGSCGVLSMVIYRIANGIRGGNFNTPEEIFRRITATTSRYEP